MTGIEAVALIAPSAAGVETVLERHNSISFDDMCRQLFHSVTTLLLKSSSGHPSAINVSATYTGGLASNTVMGTIQLKEAPRVNILFPSQ